MAELLSGSGPAQGSERARAKGSLYRLASVLVAHPLVETWQALNEGRLQLAIAEAWQGVHGRPWPIHTAGASSDDFEAEYIRLFLHGNSGKPIIPLLAGDYEALLAGQTRPVFMLNISAFYSHFGLKAAVEDEGRADEPDHLATMFEFMSVLTHLEATGMDKHREVSGYKRAQRDFIRRYLLPLAQCVYTRSSQLKKATLDPTLHELIDRLPHWLESEATTLDAQIGRYRETEDRSWAGAPAGQIAVDQNLWG